MTFYRISFIAGAALFLTTACLSKEQKMQADNPYKVEFVHEKDSRIIGLDERIPLNPKPSQIYEIIVKFNDLPYPIKPIERVPVTFDALNCKYHYGVAGAAYFPTASVYMPEPVKIDDYTYKFIFVRDALPDKDFGLDEPGRKLGICYWHLDERGFYSIFSPTGKWTETVIAVDMIRNEEILNNVTPDKPILEITYYYEKDFLSSKSIQVSPKVYGWYETIFSDVKGGDTNFPAGTEKDKLFSASVSIRKL